MPTTHYLCTSCDTTFDAPADEQPRCPECLRHNGIEPLSAAGPPDAPSTAAGRRRSPLLLALALLLALGLGVAWLLLARSTDLPAPGQLALTEPELLQSTLLHRGVAQAHLLQPFAAPPGLRAMARAIRESKQQPAWTALARALAPKLRAAHLVLALEGNTAQPARTPDQLQSLMEHPEAHKAEQRTVTSLELSCHLVATLRAAGLPAVLAQLTRLEAKVQTPQLSAGVGRYAAVVYPAGKLGSKPVAVLDPARALPLPSWAGGGDDDTMRSIHRTLTPLDDGSAAAHLMAQRALHLRSADPRQAYELSREALAAAAPSSLLLLARARVLASAGGERDALTAARKALALHDGPAERSLLALAQAGQGKPQQAVSELERALKQDPAYWPAQQVLATLLAQADPERAHKAVEAGLLVAPQATGLLVAKATLLLSKDPGRAATLLRQVARRRPEPYVLLMLYQALRRSGEQHEAERVRKTLLEQGKQDKRLAKMLELLDQALPSSQPSSQPSSLANQRPEGASAPPALPPPPTLRLPDVSLSP